MKSWVSRHKALSSGLVVALVLITWLLFTGLAARANVLNARSQLQALELSQITKDPKNVIKVLDDSTQRVINAKDLVHQPIWDLVNHIPILGRSSNALQVTTSAIADLLTAADQNLQALNTYKPKANTVIDPTLVTILARTVGAIGEPGHDSLKALSGLNLSWVPGSISEPVVQLKTDLESALPYLDQGEALVKVAPILLGLDRPRKWLLIMGNGAEARSTGGLPGGWGILQVGGGRLDLIHQESNNKISSAPLRNWQSFVSVDQANLYGDALANFTDMNQPPDYPTNARLMHALHQQYSGETVDGVMFVDEQTIAGLMKLVGEIKFNGQVLTSENIVDYVTKGVYADFSDIDQKDVALLTITREVFAAITTQNRDFVTMVQTLAPIAQSGHLHAWTKDKVIQNVLKKTALGGSTEDVTNPTHIVTLINGAGNKIDAYVHANVLYRQNACQQSGVYRKSSITVTLKNDAPSTGLPPYTSGRLDLGPGKERTQPGSTKMLVYVHVPIGSEFISAGVGSTSLRFISSGTDQGRTVWAFALPIGASSTKSLKVNFAEPAYAGVPSPKMSPQAMTNPMKIAIKTAPSC